jgi:hypothetical protein
MKIKTMTNVRRWYGARMRALLFCDSIVRFLVAKMRCGMKKVERDGEESSMETT